MRELDKEAEVRKKITIFLIFLAASFCFLVSGEKGITQTIEANQVFQAGVTAAGLEKWEIALRNFKKAQALAPMSPAVFLNLGLTNARLGSEVLASLWLRAYLELAPKAANRKNILKEIARLDATADTKAQDLLDEALKCVNILPEEIIRGAKRDLFLLTIAFSQATTGDVKMAADIAKLSRFQNIPEAAYWRYFGQYQISAGDLEGAKKTLRNIADQAEADTLMYYLACAYAEDGDEETSLEIINEITDDTTKTDALEFLTNMYAIRLEPQKAAGFADLVETSVNKARILGMIAIGYVKKGDTAKARQAALEIEMFQDQSGEILLLDTVLALGILGKTDKAIYEIKKALTGTRKGKDESTLSVEMSASFLAAALAWMGELEEAESVLRLVDKRISGRSSQMVEWARTVIMIERWDLSGVIKLAGTVSLDVSADICGSVVWRLIAKGDIESAGELVSGWPQAEGKSMGFFILARYFRSVADPENWARSLSASYRFAVISTSREMLRKIIREFTKAGDKDVLSGILPKARAVSWVSLALYCEKVTAVQDLEGYLAKVKRKRLVNIPVGVAKAGEAWAAALLNIRSTEKRITRGSI
jgi:tetratricopeptide (TPR) repeat protein